jgi:hypothetical protein
MVNCALCQLALTAPGGRAGKKGPQALYWAHLTQACACITLSVKHYAGRSAEKFRHPPYTPAFAGDKLSDADWFTFRINVLVRDQQAADHAGRLASVAGRGGAVRSTSVMR